MHTHRQGHQQFDVTCTSLRSVSNHKSCLPKPNPSKKKAARAKGRKTGVVTFMSCSLTPLPPSESVGQRRPSKWQRHFHLPLRRKWPNQPHCNARSGPTPCSSLVLCWLGKRPFSDELACASGQTPALAMPSYP